MPSKRQIDTETEKFSAALSDFLLQVREKSLAQFQYNLSENVPSGRMEIENCAEQALNTGIVSAMGGRVGFCVIATLEMCGDLLENVNAHSDAAMIRELAKKEAAS